MFNLRKPSLIFKAQFGQEYWYGKWRDTPISTTMEWLRWLRYRQRNYEPVKSGILAAGFAHRSGISSLKSLFDDLNERRVPLTVIRHDDLMNRHESVFRRANIKTIPSESLMKISDFGLGQLLFRQKPMARNDQLDYVQTDLTNTYPTFSKGRICYIQRQARVIHRFIAYTAPQLIIIPDETQPLARIAALIAKHHSIKTISIPQLTDQLKWQQRPWSFLADHTWIAHNTIRELMIARGYPEHRIRIRTSSPASQFEDRSSTTPSAIKSRVRIVFLCQALDNNRRAFGDFIHVMSSLPNATWSFRIHPQQDRWILNLALPAGSIKSAESSDMAIQNNDLFVTHSSIMAVDAIAKLKPVIVYHPGEDLPMPALKAAGCVFHANDRESLTRAVCHILEHPDALQKQQIAWRSAMLNSALANSATTLLDDTGLCSLQQLEETWSQNQT